MKENCLDIGTIQAFLDGELSSELLENAAQHLSICDDCAMQLATAEEETAVAFSALEQEFNTLVPTQRLWTKINDSIEKEKTPFWQPILAFFKNPTVAAFAGLLIVFGLFIGYLNTRNNDSTGYVAVTAKKPEIAETVVNPVPVKSVEESVPTEISKPEIKVSSTQQNRKNYRIVNANLDTGYNKRRTEIQSTVLNAAPNTDSTTPVNSEYIPGEESYVKTIASLEKTVGTSKEQVLNTSGQFNLAKNLAVVDDSINKMKSEVKRNPKNETAKQLLMASYQNKVDLLNSVAEKNELMASVK